MTAMRSDDHCGDGDRDEAMGEMWDADDPRRQLDQMAPPKEPCECFCLHCRRTFSSGQIWFQRIKGARDDFDGFWMCPTPNCGGAGFTFDIFPVDPNHPANAGWFDTDEDEEYGERSWQEDDKLEAFDEFTEDEAEEETDYDPQEPHYQMLDQWADDDEDLEGEEWKHGLAPGQRPEPSKPDWLIEEERKYDQPDERPRELDWSDRENSEREPGNVMGEDDIPF